MSPIGILARITKRRPHIELVARAVNPYWRLVAANGRTLAHSETYSSLTKARATAKSVADTFGIVVRDVSS